MNVVKCHNRVMEKKESMCREVALQHHEMRLQTLGTRQNKALKFKILVDVGNGYHATMIQLQRSGRVKIERKCEVSP